MTNILNTNGQHWFLFSLKHEMQMKKWRMAFCRTEGGQRHLVGLVGGQRRSVQSADDALLPGGAAHPLPQRAPRCRWGPRPPAAPHHRRRCRRGARRPPEPPAQEPHYAQVRPSVPIGGPGGGAWTPMAVVLCHSWCHESSRESISGRPTGRSALRRRWPRRRRGARR